MSASCSAVGSGTTAQSANENNCVGKIITKKLETVFLFLRANITKPDTINITHYDVRNICKILQDQKASDALTSTFDKHKDIRQTPIEKLVDNLDTAKDVLKNREDEKKPGKLIDRAISALDGIDKKGKPFKTDADVKAKLQKLDKLVKDLKTELGI